MTPCAFACEDRLRQSLLRSRSFGHEPDADGSRGRAGDARLRRAYRDEPASLRRSTRVAWRATSDRWRRGQSRVDVDLRPKQPARSRARLPELLLRCQCQTVRDCARGRCRCCARARPYGNAQVDTATHARTKAVLDLRSGRTMRMRNIAARAGGGDYPGRAAAVNARTLLARGSSSHRPTNVVAASAPRIGSTRR